jgi:hypothetical protein
VLQLQLLLVLCWQAVPLAVVVSLQALRLAAACWPAVNNCC